MKILVLSDSHRDISSLQLAFRNNMDVSAVIFLGDGLEDFERASALLPCKKIVAVRGNCDSSIYPYPLKSVETIDNTVLYCTHGHSEHVKSGTSFLISEAIKSNASIALFGHTHEPVSTYENGLYLMNPGSVRNNSCGIVEILPSGILCYTKKIVDGY